jgi:hypothetical protein
MNLPGWKSLDVVKSGDHGVGFAERGVEVESLLDGSARPESGLMRRQPQSSSTWSGRRQGPVRELTGRGPPAQLFPAIVLIASSADSKPWARGDPLLDEPMILFNDVV